MLAASTPKPIQATAYRSNSISSSPINLTISLIGVIPQSNLSTLSIYLPQYQFAISSTPTCSFVNSSSVTCTILASSNSTLITNYPCYSANCSILSFNMVVSGVSNLYADQSPITVSVLSSGYLSELASTVVSPSIYSTQLSNVTISMSNSTIATDNILSVSFSSGMAITSDSVVLISVDDLIFLKNSDCSYQIGNVTYTGCVILTTSNGYVSSIALKNLGSSAIPPNTMISLTIKLTNSFAAFDFTNSAFKVLVTYNNISVSTYLTTMGALLNSTSFSSVAFASLSVQRNTSKASAPIAINIQTSIPVSFFSNSSLLLSLPKSQTIVPSSHTLNCSNCSAAYLS